MDGDAFVDSLVQEMRQLFAELGEHETLEAESKGNADIVTLLTLALESEVEAAEIASLWLPSTSEMDVKSAFALQAHDEMKHYDLICRRLRELGHEPEASHQREASRRGPHYHYLTTLRTTVERLAAGPFAREAVAEVRNAQFISLCRAQGDVQTAELYETVIQPEEIHHHELGRDLLARYAVDEALQEAAATACRTSLAITEELSTLKERSTGLSGIPVS